MIFNYENWEKSCCTYNCRSWSLCIIEICGSDQDGQDKTGEEGLHCSSQQLAVAPHSNCCCEMRSCKPDWWDSGFRLNAGYAKARQQKIKDAVLWPTQVAWVFVPGFLLYALRSDIGIPSFWNPSLWRYYAYINGIDMVCDCSVFNACIVFVLFFYVFVVFSNLIVICPRIIL